MSLEELVKATGAEASFGRMIARVGRKHVTIAKSIDGNFALTAEGKELAAALAKKKSKGGKKQAAPKSDQKSDSGTDETKDDSEDGAEKTE